MTKLLRATTIVLLLLTLAAPVHAATLSGRVVDAGSDDGIAALTVTAKASKDKGGRESVTTTNQQGAFRLPKLADGRYLLTVSRGNEALYRKVVAVQGNTEKEIRLQRR